MKLGKIRINPVYLANIFKDGTFTIKHSPIPSSAKFLYAYWDNEIRCFYIVFEDESFQEIPEGGLIPTLENVVIKYYTKRKKRKKINNDHIRRVVTKYHIMRKKKEVR